MKPPILIYLLFCSICVKAQSVSQHITESDVARIIKKLSADEMLGRAVFTEGAERAAGFIESEFKAIGLQPLQDEAGFRQTFSKTVITAEKTELKIGGENVDLKNVLLLTDKPELHLSDTSKVEIVAVKPGEKLFLRFQEITGGGNNKRVLVFVDPQFEPEFKQLKEHFSKSRVVDEVNNQAAAIFVLGKQRAGKISVDFKNRIEIKSLFNVVGILPGKSKAKEFVVFSAHYDHLGIVEALEGDSIANGADDDASGVTAVISLARYFKKLNNNERTLIFVGLTAEETGGYGSRYFSSKLNSDDVVAMFNIEMIGKESKFGMNAAFITGYEKSDFGAILQRNLKGTKFTFHPDPYPDQNLFYRSDNAALAALGVPAHTVSTDQIDIDKFYHTVNDEFETLNVANITATVRAIALSSKSIVAGKDTPTRIEKLKK